MTARRALVRSAATAAAVAVLLAGLYRGTTSAAAPQAEIIRVTAERFQYTPSEIVLRKGVPVVLELTSKDAVHGFSVTELGLRADLLPGQTAVVRLTPATVGRFEFHCDNFCGTGHEGMTGTVVVRE